MVIAGLQNLSLVDFPGHLAAVVFTQGCNFKCGYCHNPDLITFDKRPGLSQEEVLNRILRHNKIIEGVVVTGGEPGIHADLPELMKRLKSTGLKVKLDTNGSNPSQLEQLLREQLLDYIAIDIKTSFSKYSLVTDQKDIETLVKKSIHITMSSEVPYEFRTTCVPGIIDGDDLREIGEEVKGAKKYTLQQFRALKTYDKTFLKVTPYDKETLYHFRDIIAEFVKETDLRGL